MSRAPLARPAFGTESSPQKPKKPVWVVWIIILLFVLGVGWYLFSQSPKKDVLGELGDSGAPAIATTGDYQAVFLDNGQVYFGKLSHKGDPYMILKDVYYLQSGAAGVDQTGNLSLQKLGNEAHGPEDQMEINKDHVLFMENMKNDSKVVSAIKQHKSGK